jgi:hypothetical protein
MNIKFPESSDVYSLEHSQYSEDVGMFPFHIGPLGSALRDNLQDCHYNNRKENKWQMLFIGSQEDCHKVMERLIKDRQRDTKAHKINRWFEVVI